MSTFVASAHPRAASGQFTEKSLASPAAVLDEIDLAPVEGHVAECSRCGDELDDHDEHGLCSYCEENSCSAEGCGVDLDDGEGADGYCGTHADIIDQHDEGHHDADPRDDCPRC